MSIGYTKSWRKKWDNPSLRGRPHHMLVFMWLIDRAEHGLIKDENGWRNKTEEELLVVRFHGKKICVRRGQVVCGTKQIEVETGIKSGSIRRTIGELQSDGLLNSQTDNRIRLVTIKNYDKYQEFEQPANNRRTTERSPAYTTKEEKKKRIKELRSLPKSLKRWLRQNGKAEGYDNWLLKEYGHCIERAWEKVLNGKHVNTPTDFVDFCKTLDAAS